MSANLDQRSKGHPNQVSGGNELRKDDDPYIQHAQQHSVRSWSDQATDGAYGAHGAPPMSNANVSDSFFQSYYNPSMSYPFMNQGLSTSEGPWSNGAENMFNMGYDYNAFYSSFGVPFNNWEYAGEYWGNSQQVRKDQRGYPAEDAYYPPEMIPADSYGMMNGAPAQQEMQEPIGTIDHGLRGMSLHSPSSSMPSGGTGGPSMDPHGRKKMVDMSQPPVMVSDSFVGGGEPSLMMAPPSSSSSSSQSVSAAASMMGGGSSGAPPPAPQGGQPKKTSWAAIASQPARPQQQMRPRTMPRPPVNPNKPHNMEIGNWDTRGGPAKAPGLPVVQPPTAQPSARGQSWATSSARSRPAPPPSNNNNSNSASPPSNSNSANNNPSSSVSGGGGYSNYSNGGGSNGGNSGGNDSSRGGGSSNQPATNGDHQPASSPSPSSSVLDQLKTVNVYNPKEFNLNPKSARFFVIKSYSEDDIHRSIKYSIWCSTEHGNKRLDQAFREREGKGPVYLIYSVNGSGHFCGISQMMSPVDYNKMPGVWAQDKWKGQFEVKWVYVKDVPNSQLRHIRLENNENKPVTNSRDTQEVPPEKGKQVLRIMHSFQHKTSIFDDFTHYEIRQEEDHQQPSASNHSAHSKQHHHQHGVIGGGYRNDHRSGGGDHHHHHHHGGHGGGGRDHRGGDHRDGRGDHHHHRGGHHGGDRGGDRGDSGRNRDNRRRQN